MSEHTMVIDPPDPRTGIRVVRCMSKSCPWSAQASSAQQAHNLAAQHKVAVTR